MFKCEKNFMEMINFRLFVDFIVALFKGKTCDQYFITLMVATFSSQCNTSNSMGEAYHPKTKIVEGRKLKKQKRVVRK